MDNYTEQELIDMDDLSWVTSNNVSWYLTVNHQPNDWRIWESNGTWIACNIQTQERHTFPSVKAAQDNVMKNYIEKHNNAIRLAMNPEGRRKVLYECLEPLMQELAELRFNHENLNSKIVKLEEQQKTILHEIRQIDSIRQSQIMNQARAKVKPIEVTHNNYLPND